MILRRIAIRVASLAAVFGVHSNGESPRFCPAPPINSTLH
jgi:hypothetical protein